MMQAKQIIELGKKMYQQPECIALVRMVGYAGISTAEAQKQIQELPFDKEKLVKATEDLVDIDAKMVQLKPQVRKLAFQMLGFPPEYVHTDIGEMLKTSDLPKAERKAEKPARKPRGKKAAPVAQEEAPGVEMDLPASPVMEQYRAAKKNHPEMILLFRVGDFYEMFEQDAETCSKALGLTLTSRNGVGMCGFPHHALERHLHKLLKDGFRVAVCDQVDSADGKSVKREVIPAFPEVAKSV